VTLFLGWLALRSAGRFCQHRVTGIFVGCGDHYWHKIIAWSRYLGTRYIERVLPIETCPSCDGRLKERSQEIPVSVTPSAEVIHEDVDTREKREPNSRDSSPSPRMQALSVYSIIAAGLTTVAAFVFTLVLAAH
jgi:hypothetical protein